MHPLKPFLLSLLFTLSLFAQVNCQQTQKVQSFVERFYTVVLSRSADNAGLDDWTNKLTSGALTGADVANGFVLSEEFTNKNTPNETYLHILYKAFFNREADSDGLNGWLEHLQNGTTRAEVLHGFLYSQEFINLANSYGIKAYEGATFSSSSLTDFVKRFYSVILGREADTQGLNGWTTQLSTGESTGADIAKGFILSQEYNMTSKNDTQYLTDLYRAFFNREADSDGFNGWIHKLQSGTTRQKVLNGFLASQEFINLTNSFGIVAFEGAPTLTPVENLAPVAQASYRRFGNSIVFDTNGSTDEDGEIVCHWWVENEGVLSFEERFSKDDFTSGTHHLRLTVVDNKKTTNSVTKSITSSITNSTERTIKQNQPITMLGTYTGDFNDIKSYTWKENGVVLSYSVSFMYTPSMVGTHTLTFTIEKNDGSVQSHTETIHVLASNSDNANTHEAKTNMLVYAKLNESVILKGAYTGKTDVGITYQWKEGETLLSDQANFDYAPHSLGTHILTLTITDSQGYRDEALLTLFTIGGASNKVVNLDSNGNMDNDVQINAALQEVANAGGGVVHLNAGTYVIENPVVFMGDNTILEGDGSENTIIQLKENANWGILHADHSYEEADPMIRNSASALHNLALMNIQIDGNKYNQRYTYDVNNDGNIDASEHFLVHDGIGNYVALDFRSRNGSANVSNLLFSNIFLNRNNDDALAVTNPTNSIVEKCKARNIGHSTVYFYNPSNLLVKENDFLITANSGVRWYDGNHIIVKDNLLEGESTKTGNSNFGIEVTSGQTPDVLDDVLIKGNTIRFTAGAGIALDGKTPITSKNVIIKNNIIYQCGNVGTWANQRETGAINLKNFTNTLIENNTIVNTIGSAIRLGGDVGFNDSWEHIKGLTATIQNNIITHSVTDINMPQKIATYGVDIAEGNSAICKYNNAWHNEAGNYRGCNVDTGNISEDPHFQSIVLGDTFSNTNDTDADLHLKSTTGRYHAGTWETDALSSSSINAGAPESIYTIEPNENGHRINMGAYGNTPYASKGIGSPPVAVAGKNQYLRADTKNFVYVDLDGSASFDNGTIQNYMWKKDGFILGYGVTLPRTPIGIGKHTIELTVTDENNLWASTFFHIFVRPPIENSTPTANAGENISVTDIYGKGSASAILDAVNSFDVDGMLVYYQWSEEGNVLSNKARDVLNFSVGEHQIMLEVTDNEGKKSTDTMKVTVLPKGNYALQFNSDSNDEYVSISNIQVPENNLTIEMWMKQESTTNDIDALINMGGFDGQRLTIKSSIGGASWGIEDYAQGSITSNEWHHIAYVVENKHLKEIYIDGVAQVIIGDKNITMPSPFFQIASFYQTTADDKNFRGVIDELRIWSGARSTIQINSNKDKELTGDETNLIGYWNFNYGSGTKLIDLSGGRDGDIINMEREDWVEGAPVH